MVKFKYQIQQMTTYFRKNKTLSLILILIVLSIVLLHKQFFETKPATELPLTRVQVSKATYGQKLEQGIMTTSSLKAITDVEIKSKVEALIQKIFVKKNQYVKTGEVLLELEHANATAKMASAKAQIDINNAAANAAKWKAANAAIEQRRYDSLIEKGYATRQEVDEKRTSSNTAEADYEQALASIEYARAEQEAAAAELNDCLIKAPFDGTILDDYELAIGSKVTTDSSVIRIADISKIKCTINIPENKLSIVKPGMAAIITCDTFPDEKFAGIVSVVNTFIDTANHTFQADIIIDNAVYDNKLLPGMFAKIFLIEQQNMPQSLTVPAEAISDDSTVMIVKDNKIIIQKVITGFSDGKNTVITDGLNEGDIVVINGGKTLREGDSVSYSSNS